jgi:hypothetical protein
LLADSRHAKFAPKEIHMNNTRARCSLLCAALGLATTAWAASPPSSGEANASSTAPAASSSATKDIKAYKNSRLHKCDVMTGDEKKACQADAAAHARAEKKEVAAHGASTTKN